MTLKFERMSKNFTLIEMLVVIAIISILASMLMPSLMKAVATAKIANCANNLKTQSIASAMYASDSGNYLMPTHYVNSVGQHISWDDLLGDYDGRNLTYVEKTVGLSAAAYGNSIYRCPAYPYPNNIDASGNITMYAARNYSMNGTGNSNGFIGENGVAAYNAVGDCFTLNNSRIKAPSQVFLIVEYPRRNNLLGNGSNSVNTARSTSQLQEPTTMQTHDGTFTYLFCDGHVVSMNALLTEEPCFWTRRTDD